MTNAALSPGTCLRQALAAAALLAVLADAPACAATFRVDESGTVVSQPVVGMRWRQLVPGKAADNTVEATVRVDVRLNLAPWVNKSARIYMVAAPADSMRVLARWTTQGRLLPGSAYTGTRALVFDAAVSAAVLSESLLLSLETDGQYMPSLQTLSFHFEIEVPN